MPSESSLPACYITCTQSTAAAAAAAATYSNNAAASHRDYVVAVDLQVEQAQADALHQQMDLDREKSPERSLTQQLQMRWPSKKHCFVETIVAAGLAVMAM